MTKAAKVLWVAGGLVVIVGSFFLTDAVRVRGLARRYDQSFLNPEIGAASKYDVEVLVPPGNDTAQYDVFHANHNTYVSVRETPSAHWANLGDFDSDDNGTFSVRLMKAPPERNDGYHNGQMEPQSVKFLPVA
ncbi:hypothetical protein [Sulfobacillus thermosulfidooxidans]|uniref:hypothetical protein n=1 Tax=Sulfobacillus thermosulfidooxidans TaxID=28034 RepID=UPI0003FD726E|nr:hypothetical protein [Sulfobacillus thermosulfidooxidans]